MNVGPEGEREGSIFSLQGWKATKKTSLKGIYSGVNVPRADTGGSCTCLLGPALSHLAHRWGAQVP